MGRGRNMLTLELLLLGFDPATGASLPADHICRRPDIADALCQGLSALREQEYPESSEPEPALPEPTRPKPHRPVRAAQDWSPWDDARLRELYESDVNEAEMCRLLGLQKKELRKRLEQLGLKPDEYSRRGKNWIPEEDDELRRLFGLGRPVSRIAKALQRSQKAVRLRMERLQLIRSADEYPESPEESTRSDQKDLKRRFLSGTSVAELAHLYQLSEKAIRARLFHAGLSDEAPVVWRKAPNKGVWTEKEIEALKQMYLSHTPLMKIAFRFERTISEIEDQLKKLGLMK